MKSVLFSIEPGTTAMLRARIRNFLGNGRSNARIRRTQPQPAERGLPKALRIPPKNHNRPFMHCSSFCHPGQACLFILLLAWHVTAAAVVHQPQPQPRFLPTADWQKSTLTVDHTQLTHITPWLRIQVASGDTLSGLFNHIGLAASQWHALLALGSAADPIRHLQPGDTFYVRRTLDGRLAALDFPISGIKTLVIRRIGHRLTAETRQRHTTTRQRLIRGMVAASFSTSLQNAGTPSRIATALAHIFDGRINLSRNMHAGDSFSIIYTAAFRHGKRVQVGPILAASIHTHGRYFRAFRAMDANDTAHYYNALGKSYALGIERTPLDYSYVSSPFNMHRMHPILGIVRPHTGVDLAAPRGTPVHAAADGTVAFVGWIHGYGRVVKIKHTLGYSTRYAHLSRFAHGLGKDTHVVQGQVIGFVGASGLATGYHLHFEIRHHGIPHNPMTMPLPSATPLSGQQLIAFASRIQPLIAQLGGDGTASLVPIAANSKAPPHQVCASASPIGLLTPMNPSSGSAEALDRLLCSMHS